MKSLSRVRLFATPWTVAHPAPPSMGFSRQEYWSGLPFPSPGDLPDPGIEPTFPASEGRCLTPGPRGKCSPVIGFRTFSLPPLSPTSTPLSHQLCLPVPSLHCCCCHQSEVAQSCPTLCDPVDCSPPGSSAHGILQARILEWVAISFSRGSS